MTRVFLAEMLDDTTALGRAAGLWFAVPLTPEEVETLRDRIEAPASGYARLVPSVQRDYAALMATR